MPKVHEFKKINCQTESESNRNKNQENRASYSGAWKSYNKHSNNSIVNRAF